MITLIAMLHSMAAEPWSLRDDQPRRDGRAAMVVVTPGYEPEAFEPLAEALGKRGLDVHVLSFACTPMDTAAMAEAMVEAAARLEESPVVVAHGLGASLALMAGDRLAASHLVLLGPAIAAWPSEAADLAAAITVGPQVDLGVSIDQWTTGRSIDPRPVLAFGGSDVASVLLGDSPPLQACASGPYAAEVQQWYRQGGPPVALDTIDTPVWIGVGLLDRLAPVEAVIPASRELAQRELVRLGITRLDGRDFNHLDLLRERVPLRLAARAARRGVRP